MKRYLLSLILAFTATGAMAVDGYKEVKFGSSFEAMRSAGLCDFQIASKQPEHKNIVMYNCLDFQFDGNHTMAAASFIGGKFGKLQIMVDSPVNSVLEALYKKYGAPSSSSTEEEMQNAIITGNPIYVRFDKDTVIWIGPYISIHFLSLNPLLVRRRRYSRGERYPSALCGCHSL